VDRCSKELFLASCGLSGPLRLDLEEPRGNDSRVFEVPFVVAGGDPGTDLVVDDPTVSRRQVYLQAIAGRVFYVDLGSRIEGDREHERDRRGWVDHQRGICIGPVRIRAGVGEGPGELADPLASRFLDDSPLPVVTLEFPQQPGRPSWNVGRVLTLLGRTPECRLRFLDHDVSNFHCSLLRTPSGAWVVDLLGRTGIRLNGEAIRWARLEDGDRLEVGRHPIRIRCEMPATNTNQSGRATRPVTAVAVVIPRPERPVSLLEIGNDRAQGPPALSSNELVQSIMANMANQFGQMQQQMFDQFQQAMVIMTQTLGSVHRDQMAQVRDEVDQLRRLNQDLLALQVQAGRGNPSLAALPSLDSASSGGIATGEALSRIEALLQASLTASNSAPPSQGTIGVAEADPESKPRPSTPPGRERRHETMENGTSPREDPSSSKPSSTPSQVSSVDQVVAHPHNLSDDDIHSLLCRRMAKLQEERPGRWRRISRLWLGR
jgi:pSer/pThr/pTyr-binding forkhead associated (FHA) protein